MIVRFSAAAAALLLMTGHGFTQEIVISPERQTEIREYVVKQEVAPVELPSDFQLSVGSTIPDTVELNAVEVPDVKYRYVVIGNQTVLVEPATRKVVYIIQ